MPLIEAIDAGGRLLPAIDREQALSLAESLHRDFRPAIGAGYGDHLAVMFAEGARLAVLIDENEVRALAVWRMFHTTYCGLRLEIDDLVTAESGRSRGYGATLLIHVEGRASALGCDTVTLNSATWRTDAHRFYARQHYPIVAFHFSKALKR